MACGLNGCSIGTSERPIFCLPACSLCSMAGRSTRPATMRTQQSGRVSPAPTETAVQPNGTPNHATSAIRARTHCRKTMPPARSSLPTPSPSCCSPKTKAARVAAGSFLTKDGLAYSVRMILRTADGLPPAWACAWASRTKYTPGASARTSFAPGLRSNAFRPLTSNRLAA
jgi:hypothetical protein